MSCLSFLKLLVTNVRSMGHTNVITTTTDETAESYVNRTALVPRGSVAVHMIYCVSINIGGMVLQCKVL